MSRGEARPPAADNGYPRYPRGRNASILHGRTVADPYRELELDPAAPDAGEAGEAIGVWLRGQRALAREFLDDLPEQVFFERALARAATRIRRSVPTARGTRLFYTEGPAHAPSATLFMQRGRRAPVPVLSAAEHEQRPGSRISAWSASPDGSMIAYQICEAGSEEGPLRVRGLDEPFDLPVAEQLRAPSVAWGGPGSSRPDSLYYPRSKDAGPGLWRFDFASRGHTCVWSPPSAQTQVFIVPAVSPGGDLILLTVRYGADRRNALLLASLSGTGGEPMRPRVLLKQGRATTVARFGPDGRVYVLSRPEQGQECLQVFAPERPDPADWDTLVRAGNESLRGFVPLPTAVALVSEHEGHSALSLVETGSGTRSPLSLPGPGTVSALTANQGEPASLWVGYAGIGEPAQVLRYSVGHAAPRPAKPWYIPAGSCAFPQTRWERVSCVSADGTVVDISILSTLDHHRADRGPRPLMLAVYGGFGLSVGHRHSDALEAWLAAGGVHAIAQVRGGGEKGVQWHAAARGARKPRSVEDLIAAAEHLILTRRTTPEQLVVVGGSNGGMLAAAAAIARPGLFRACVPIHAVTDPVRSSLLGAGQDWIAEYGDPQDEQVLDAMLSYSPYHNVRETVRYPAFLLMAGSSDRRVPPAHSRKLCSALQYASASPRAESPILLREEERAGHGGMQAASVGGWLADRLTFAAHLTGLRPPEITGGA